jgi:hypothetical protein
MSEKYEFKDRLWDVRHVQSGKSLGHVSVNADSVREAYKQNKNMQPSTHEDEILDNALWNFLDSHGLNPEDIEISEKVERAEKPKRAPRKASEGGSCW